MPNSLVVRSFLTASAWSVVALAIAGVILVTMYRGAIVRSFDQRLEVYLKTLIGEVADTEEDSDRLADPGNLREPRFGFPMSGWYWEIIRLSDKKIMLTSDSLQGENLDITNIDISTNSRFLSPNRLRHFDGTGPSGNSLRLAALVFSISENQSYLAVVAGNTDEITTEIQVFGGQVALILFVLGLGLVLTTFFQVRYGLRPLRKIRDALVSIRSGKSTSLEGDFPDEIEPLVHEMNALIASNLEILDRSRTQVGNLAHALKTPLSVIRNEAARQSSGFSEKVVEQAEMMSNQVTLYLDRARFAARRNALGVATRIEPVITRLHRAMLQIHQDRNLTIDMKLAPGLTFRGEQQDLEEMIGNLVDNACKWAKTKVLIFAIGQVARDGRHRLQITIEDDGPGLSAEQAQLVMGRGERLDENTPGSGLGLSIVSELARSYGGSISLSRSHAGGLRCELDLPSAQM